jgi:DNA-binding NarL/FixJ family response regulator
MVMFSSSQEPQDVARAYKLGANSFVVKPVEYKDFLAAVQQMVNYWFRLNVSSPA